MTEQAGRGNGGPVERVEKQNQLSHSFHRPLEISQKARDSHIPTARLRGHGKVENQKQVSHFPTTARDDDSGFSPKTKKPRKDVSRYAASAFPYTPQSNGTGFMLIFQLENALVVANRIGGRHLDSRK
jgi:hypothetical protein